MFKKEYNTIPCFYNLWVEYSHFYLPREPSKFKWVGLSKTLRLLFNIRNYVTILNCPTVLLMDAQMGKFSMMEGFTVTVILGIILHTIVIQYMQNEK